MRARHALEARCAPTTIRKVRARIGRARTVLTFGNTERDRGNRTRADSGPKERSRVVQHESGVAKRTIWDGRSCAGRRIESVPQIARAACRHVGDRTIAPHYE